MNKCSIENCDFKVQARGLCNTHYWRLNIYGDPLYVGVKKKAAILKKEAIARGETTYFTDEPCINGHISKRKLSGYCVECRNIRNKEKYKTNPIKQNTATKNWRDRNKEYCKLIVKKWDSNNRDRKNVHAATRRALFYNAEPKWANKDKIKAIYLEAKNNGMVVDHIIPLNNKIVCGLHVEFNLQLLSKTENLSKGNKYIV